MSLSIASFRRFASHDPWENLAREETWLDELEPGASAALVYVNSPCIVLGKHQNPLREVRLVEASKRGVPLVRRASGGGTVWHDEGNLNWSFLIPKASYRRDEVSRFLADALAPLGFSLSVGEKGDLFLDGKKVSGAAYLFRRDRVLHHGTLLCSARLDDLRGVLGPTGTLTEWIGVASRPMPVANLGIAAEAASQAFETALGVSAVSENDGAPFEAKVSARAAERRTAAWLWDQTPPFTWEGNTLSGWVRAQVRDGLVEQAWDDRNQIFSNIVGKRFFSPEFFGAIPGELP